MKYVIGNWKVYKSLDEDLSFLRQIKGFTEGKNYGNRKIILLPPSLFLIPLFQKIKELGLPLALGVQNISTFESGSHTGEISVAMVREFIRYALVGHSERRASLGETAEMVNQKIGLCEKYNIVPLVCLRSTADLISLDFGTYSNRPIIVFEDPQEIGGERASGVKKIMEFYREACLKFPKGVQFIYGGSVGVGNSKDLWQREEIDGLLVGHHSLNAAEFAKIALS